MLLTTHDMTEVSRLTQRVVLIDTGRDEDRLPGWRPSSAASGSRLGWYLALRKYGSVGG